MEEGERIIIFLCNEEEETGEAMTHLAGQSRKDRKTTRPAGCSGEIICTLPGNKAMV